MIEDDNLRSLNIYFLKFGGIITKMTVVEGLSILETTNYITVKALIMKQQIISEEKLNRTN